MNVLRSKRAVAGLGAAVVSIVGLTLFVVLPALASSPGDRVPPTSSRGHRTRSTSPQGGNATCSNCSSEDRRLPNLTSTRTST